MCPLKEPFVRPLHELGQVIPCDALVIAMGPWSVLLERWMPEAGRIMAYIGFWDLGVTASRV